MDEMQPSQQGDMRPASPQGDMRPASPQGDMRPLFAMHADMCQALANQHRLAIMYSLKDGEKCVGDIGVELGISVQNVSQHLRILKERLLVRSRKEGQTVYYSVTNPKFVDACALIREALLEQHRAEGESLQAARQVGSAIPFE
jgi:ArsR family transcriptional regulator, virulence genes transcriptional regulator